MIGYISSQLNYYNLRRIYFRWSNLEVLQIICLTTMTITRFTWISQYRGLKQSSEKSSISLVKAMSAAKSYRKWTTCHSSKRSKNLRLTLFLWWIDQSISYRLFALNRLTKVKWTRILELTSNKLKSIAQSYLQAGNQSQMFLYSKRLNSQTRMSYTSR